jgi:hypothetical protein
MSININNDKNIPIDTHACYEELASQEELYLEETEEEVVAILTSYVSPTLRMVTNADEQLLRPSKNWSLAIQMIHHSARIQSRRC